MLLRMHLSHSQLITIISVSQHFNRKRQYAHVRICPLLRLEGLHPGRLKVVALNMPLGPSEAAHLVPELDDGLLALAEISSCPLEIRPLARNGAAETATDDQGARLRFSECRQALRSLELFLPVPYVQEARDVKNVKLLLQWRPISCII